METIRLKNDCGADAVVERLREHGYVIVDNLVTNDLMDRIGAEMAPYVERCGQGRDSFFGFHTKRTGAMIARSPASHELVMNPLALETAQKFLDKATSFRLNLTQVMTILPGGEPQKLHCDEIAWDFFPFPLDYNVQLNMIWAMTDFTDVNGATRIVPGTHKFHADPDHYGEADMVCAEMPRGSALFYTGKVLHAAGCNRSDQHRQGINITYSVGWVCQEENQYLSTPLEVARTLPDDLLRVMGYQLSCYAMGYVADSRDPMTVLRDMPENEVFGLDLMKKTAGVQDGVKTFMADLKG
ncbi:phytanoyl-CoA dioxygenase family protein [Sphingosinicella xenopeptidilytica]|uniref:Phytanoyl-CoA dioxygenase family protein n=1 Tax=Sphingosinicella xenopeptidilytica TaxID=364098 RepID=A0ABW3C674_SPHXN